MSGAKSKVDDILMRLSMIEVQQKHNTPLLQHILGALTVNKAVSYRRTSIYQPRVFKP
jgi:hypothetical protein